MKTLEIKTEVARILRCKVENISSRVLGLKLGDSCNRCGGCGEYSFNLMYGTKCFGCNGSGQNISDTLAGWKRILSKAQELSDVQITEYINGLIAKKRAQSAFDELMKAWKAAAEKAGMAKHHTQYTPEHKALNAAIAPIADKISKLGFQKGTENEILELLEYGLKTVAQKESELFN
jgi:hypothetical protein